MKPVLMYGGSRKIIFSCFHPDICTMQVLFPISCRSIFSQFIFHRMRMKQNKYPVMFLTQGITKRFAEYHEPRTHNIPMAVHFARSIGILVSEFPWINFLFCFNVCNRWITLFCLSNRVCVCILRTSYVILHKWLLYKTKDWPSFAGEKTTMTGQLLATWKVSASTVSFTTRLTCTVKKNRKNPSFSLRRVKSSKSSSRSLHPRLH